MHTCRPHLIKQHKRPLAFKLDVEKISCISETLSVAWRRARRVVGGRSSVMQVKLTPAECAPPRALTCILRPPSAEHLHRAVVPSLQVLSVLPYFLHRQRHTQIDHLPHPPLARGCVCLLHALISSAQMSEEWLMLEEQTKRRTDAIGATRSSTFSSSQGQLCFRVRGGRHRTSSGDP